MGRVIDVNDEFVLMQSNSAKAAAGYREEGGTTDLDKFDTILEPYLEANKEVVPMMPNHRVLGSLGIAAITYFVGCGGPIGSEPIIAAGGPMIGLAAMIAYPLICTVPYAYMIAELCSAFPEDGGFAIWVLNAFGPFWGFQVGYWSWVSGILNSALLPGLIVGVITKTYDVGPLSEITSYLIKAAIAIVLTIPSLVGTRYVERGSILLLALVFIPFIIFGLWGLAKSENPANLGQIRHANITIIDDKTAELSGPVDVDWALLINTLFWNYDGINMASVFGGEVQNPARVYSRAIAMTIGLTMFTYIFPAPGAVLTNTPHWSTYGKETYPLVAHSIGGSGLQNMIIFSSVCSTVGLYISGMYTKSFQLSGMAENQMLPRILAHRNASFDTPHHSILLTLGFTLLLISVDFNKLLPITNVFSGAAELLIIFAGIQLRRKLPYIPRPTKVPGGIAFMAIMSVPPAAVLFYIMFGALHSMFSIAMTGICVVPGILYGFYQVYRHRSSVLTPTAMFV